MRLKSIYASGMKALDGEYELGPLTHIVGPNAVGKTALIYAIDLLCKASISGIGKHADRIMALKSSQKDSLLISGTFDVGENLEFELKRTWDKSGTVVTKQLEFTGQSENTRGRIRDAEGELAGKFRVSLFGLDLIWFKDLATTDRRNTLLSLISKSGDVGKDRSLSESIYIKCEELTDSEKLRKILSEEIDDVCKSASFGNVIDQLNAVKEAVRKRKAKVKEEFETLESTLRTLGLDGAMKVDTARINDLKAEKKALDDEIESLTKEITKAEGVIKQRNTLLGNIEINKKQLPDAVRSKEDIEADQADINKAIEDLTSRKNGLDRDEGIITSSINTRKQAISSNLVRLDNVLELGEEDEFLCDTCGSTMPANEFCEHLRREIKIDETLIIDLEKVQSDLLDKLREIKKQLEEAKELKRDLGIQMDLRIDFDTLQKQIRKSEAQISALSMVAVDELESDQKVKKERRSTINEGLEGLIAAESKMQTFAKSDASKQSVSLKIEAYDIFSKAIGKDGIDGEIIRKYIVPFVEIVKEIFGIFYSDREFVLSLENERGQEVCDFGFIKDGENVKFETASKSEQLLMALSIAVAMCRSDLTSNISILLIDNAESAFEENHELLFAATNKVLEKEWVDNVVIAGTTPTPDIEGIEVTKINLGG